MSKQKVLLTGSTGSMGGEALKEMLRRADKYDTVVLVRGSDVNRKKMKKYEGNPALTVVWGDLTSASDCEKAMEGVDAVLHPAAFISPAADHNPPMARKANTEGTVNLVNAVKKQPDGAGRIKFVNVGTVASYGDRLPPYHMVRVGDPLKPSVGDFYAVTKMNAEKAVMESGLKYWATMRQTYIAIPNPWTLMDPILYHQPPNTCIELVTSEDAGYGLVNALEAPEEFFGRVYNMGGGPSCRFVYYDYLERSMPIFGLGDFRKIMDRNWYALRNFHCCWYEDSKVLNDYLGFWRNSYEDHLRQVEETIPLHMKAGKLSPNFIIKMYLKRMADPYHWVQKGETEKVKAFYGSREAWKQIGTWDGYDPHVGVDSPVDLPKPPEDLHELAKWRGGECVSDTPVDEFGRLKWKCGFGHEFDAAEVTVRTGHWCPECGAPPWNYDEVVKKDGALAAIYTHNHAPDEHQKVDWLYAPNA